MSDKQIPDHYPGKYYQPLFDLMSQEHGLTLLETQMADIIDVVNKMQALHPSESTGVKGAVWVYTARGLPKDGTIVLCEYKSGDLSHMEYLDCNKDWWLRNVHRWLDESPTAAGETEESIFDQYRAIKEKIGKLGYNTFINSIEVEQYREWLRNDRYKHRIEWFEKEYPNGLYSKDDDGELFGVNIMTKKFLAEADAAYDKPTAAGDGKEEKAFAQWLAENTQTVWESKIPLYRYCDKNNEWGNYTIDDIYLEYEENKH